MSINKINGLNPNYYSKAVSFKGERDSENYENPVSRNTEKNLAILSSAGISAVAGLIAFGLTTCISSSKKVAGGIGAVAALVVLALSLPAKLYNTKVRAFVKEKEMDVFSRDRALKTNLTEEVHKEVKDPEVSLDKKLDDNLKLQMANRGSAIGIANITSQS